MVKNKKGGRNHKKMSSRHTKMAPKSFKLRLPREEEEVIARVIKVNGFGTVDVLCNDGVKRLCIIRKKFRGRNRRDNDIRLHSIVLTGIRSWEVVSQGKKPKSDLIYVYTNEQKTQLKQGGHINSCLFVNDGENKEVGFDFSNQKERVKLEKEDDDIDIAFADI